MRETSWQEMIVCEVGKVGGGRGLSSFHLKIANVDVADTGPFHHGAVISHVSFLMSCFPGLLIHTKGKLASAKRIRERLGECKVFPWLSESDGSLPSHLQGQCQN